MRLASCMAASIKATRASSPFCMHSTLETDRSLVKSDFEATKVGACRRPAGQIAEDTKRADRGPPLVTRDVVLAATTT